jgi:carbon monoxide dehydrogenase subunit G
VEEVLDAGENEYLEKALVAIDRIDAITSSVETLARTGSAFTDVEPVDVRQVAETAWTTVESAGASLQVETTATMDLQESDSGGTVAQWSAAAEVSGLLASLGQRALGGVTKRLVSNFFSDVEELATEGVEATSQLEGAPKEDVELEELDESAVEGTGE